MSEKRYIIGGKDGWLRVRRESNDEIVSLPEYLQVEFKSNRGGRDHFIALEGVHKGTAFTVKEGNLGKPLPAYKPAAKLTFHIGKKELIYPGGKIEAFTVEASRRFKPIAPGMYPIQIPDFAHELGGGYLSNSAYAKNWFFLGHGIAVYKQNDRYLHTGTVSEGCVPVSPSNWTELYQYLILCRTGDGKNVGSITVYR